MTVRVVEEGRPFEIHGEDRAFLARTLEKSLKWTEHGVVIWSVVGHLSLPSGTTLVIRSAKAPLACVLSWAAYVDPALSDLKNLRVLDDDVGDEGDVGAALARVFCATLWQVLGAHGLRRRYRRVSARTSTVRGAIDFAALARSGGELTRMPCIVWERLPRTVLNQLLVAALVRIERDSLLRKAAGPLLLELRALLVDVAPAVDPDLLAGRRSLDRDELPFATVLALARLLLRGAGLSTGKDDGGVGFLVPLDVLFERAVVRALDDAGCSGVAQHPAIYDRWDNGFVKGGDFRIDYFIPREGGIVVDAKYKWRVDAGNLQQMVTYCHLLGVQRAVLVFPDGHIHDRRSYVLHHPRGGNVRVDILELPSRGRSVAAWRSAGRVLADAIFGTTNAHPESN